jgi:GNAT superfamily N-acetyltransferase
MSATPTHIRPRHDLTITEIDRLEQQLYDHNRRATGRHDGEDLAFVAVDEHGTQIGAVAGYSWAGIAEIKQFWVDEHQRGHGIGRAPAGSRHRRGEGPRLSGGLGIVLHVPGAGLVREVRVQARRRADRLASRSPAHRVALPTRRCELLRDAAAGGCCGGFGNSGPLGRG